jgi:hypothetical protein
MTAESLDHQIEQAKRDFDNAISNPVALQAAWMALSELVKRRGEMMDEAASPEIPC